MKQKNWVRNIVTEKRHTEKSKRNRHVEKERYRQTNLKRNRFRNTVTETAHIQKKNEKRHRERDRQIKRHREREEE